MGKGKASDFGNETSSHSADGDVRECRVCFFTKPWEYSRLVSWLLKIFRLENNIHFHRWILQVEYAPPPRGKSSELGEVFQFEAVPIDGCIHVTSSRLVATSDYSRPSFENEFLKTATARISPKQLMQLAARNSYNGSQAPILAVGAKCHSAISELAQTISPKYHLP